MHSIEFDTTIHADPAAVWETWTDIARFPEWDPREEEARIDGPFAVGTTGYTKQRGNPGGVITLVAVEEGRLWSAEKPIPGGRIVIEHRMESLGDGAVRVGKRYRVYGPMQVAFRLFFERQILAALPGSFAALEREARHRASVLRA